MDVRRGTLALVGLVLLGVAFAACQASPPTDAQARLASVEAEGQALTQAADGLEARLLAGRSALAHWEEMARRHREVSAVACRVNEGHQLDMGRARLSVRKPPRERVVAKAPEASRVSIQ